MNPALKQIEADARARGMNMTDVCRTAGLNYATWWRWCRAKTEPRTSNLDRLRRAINPSKK
jgi:DNA-binding phage protein